jgi:hypothetical protein
VNPRSSGDRIRRIIWVKNLALTLIVGIPTLALTAIITVNSEDNYRLILTLPGVAFPILTWIGVGNIVSVTLPVAVAPLRRRWEQRRQLRPTARWLIHLALPYALLYAVDPIGDLPAAVFHHLHTLPRTAQAHGIVLASIGLSLWALTTACALTIVRIRHIRIR